MIWKVLEIEAFSLFFHLFLNFPLPLFLCLFPFSLPPFLLKSKALTKLLVKSLDTRHPMDANYLDVCTAFDTVPHSILLTELERCGLLGGLFSA